MITFPDRSIGIISLVGAVEIGAAAKSSRRSIHLSASGIRATASPLAPAGSIRQKRRTRPKPGRATILKKLSEALVLRPVLFWAALAVAASGLVTPAPAGAEDKPYSVVDGKVDLGTYNGYRRYHASCHVCHGPDGLGSSYAPSLVDSLKTMPYEGFTEVVINGRQNLAAGQEKVMPGFGNVEDVALYIDDIYAYLKARSDGAIGRGRPQRQ
jgi:methanol metabolism-related c-type cytochrome